MIDVHRDQLLPDGPDQQGGDDGTVHPAGQRQQDLFIADLGADGLHLLRDERIGELLRCDALHAFRTLVVLHDFPPFIIKRYC